MGDERSDAWTTITPSRTTRRSVMRTGAKLAYAAPLVAASLAASASSVEALSGGPACIHLNQDCTGLDSSYCCGELRCRLNSDGRRTCR